MLELLNSIAVSFDFPILDWIRANIACGFLDPIMKIITMFGDAGLFWIACSVVLLFFKKYRRTGLAMGLALLMGVIICNVTMKPLIARPRPYDLKAEMGITIPLIVERMHDFSFPSGHTIASFEASVVLLMNDKRLGIPAVILAILIAFSRLYLYVHYPTDVIFSVIAGSLFAILANYLIKKIPDKKGKYETAA